MSNKIVIRIPGTEDPTIRANWAAVQQLSVDLYNLSSAESTEVDFTAINNKIVALTKSISTNRNDISDLETIVTNNLLRIGTIDIDMSAIADDYVLAYNATSGNIEWEAQSGSGSFNTFFDGHKSTQSVSHNNWEKVLLDTIIEDDNSEWDAGNYWWVCPADGVYTVSIQINWATNTTGDRYCGAYEEVAGVFFLIDAKKATTSEVRTHVCAARKLSAGDHVALYGKQTSGGPLNVSSSFLNITRNK